MNRSIDPWLVSFTILLIVAGLVMVYSASAVVALDSSGDEARYFVRQLIAVGVGLLLAAGTAVTPTRIMRSYRWGFYLVVLAGLVGTYTPFSYKANGAARWVGFGAANLQPSEFAKISVLLILAHFLDRYRAQIGSWRVVVGSILVPAVPCMLVLGQPDFGTTAIIGGLCAIMLFVAGLRVSHILLGGGAAAVAGTALVMSAQYRMNRITSFTDPWSNEATEGYHIIQSWVAMHSGGLWGQGLGNSLAKLHFLPEPWTDFIGAVIAEELGLMGIVGLLLAFTGFVWRGLTIARRARDAFGMLMAATLTAMIGFEAFFNLAVVMGLVPPKGLVLPFISYGASAMMANLWAVGILLSIAAESNEVDVAEGWPERHLTRAPARPAPAR